MSVPKQLYELQEIDRELDSNEQALGRITSQLGESETLASVRQKRATGQQGLEELARQQRSLEWEIDDLSVRLTTAEGTLYSGRIRNPKELSNLQHEIEVLRAKRSQLEDKALETMEKVELASKAVAELTRELEVVQAEWESQQQQLSASMEQAKTALTSLRHRRQLLAAEIEPEAVTVYHELRRQKGTAVAKVEQGICRGCRISLPVTELQLARSGNLVRCSSCGRILFLA